MWQKNGFDRFPEFKFREIEFEVGDKYLFRQLTGLLIRQSCQACSSKPLARYHSKKDKSKDQVKDLNDKKKTKKLIKSKI
jgi:hypothetical protein